MESDFCDRSGVEYFLAKKRLENFRVVVFRSEGKILLTLFGDHIFHLVTSGTTAISHLLIIDFQRGSRHGLTIFGDMIHSDNI